MRLLTRSDFDGLGCAALLREKGIVDSYKFVHPKDIQDNLVEVTSDDVMANIPYVQGCGLWFDHHASEDSRLNIENLDFEGNFEIAPSAAQVVWDYYDGEKSFKAHFLPLLEAVNKTDSADLTREEVLNAEGWILISFVMDPRTGLGRFKDYRISNYQLMLDMIEYCRTKSVEEILEIPDVKERTSRYHEQQDLYVEMLKKCCTVDGNVIVTNLLNEDTIYCGNRFLVYAQFAEQNIEVRVMWGKDKQNVVFSCGHSIISQTSGTDVGKLMLKYNGGGHEKVGTCQVPFANWEDDLKAIVSKIKEDG